MRFGTSTDLLLQFAYQNSLFKHFLCVGPVFNIDFLELLPEILLFFSSLTNFLLELHLHLVDLLLVFP